MPSFYTESLSCQSNGLRSLQSSWLLFIFFVCFCFYFKNSTRNYLQFCFLYCPSFHLLFTMMAKWSTRMQLQIETKNEYDYKIKFYVRNSFISINLHAFLCSIFQMLEKILTKNSKFILISHSKSATNARNGVCK